MKNFTPIRLAIISAAICLTFSLASYNASATITTWDPQATALVGTYYTSSLTGTWENAKWSTSESGQATPVNWIEGTDAEFAAHSGTGTPAFTVTMNANHTVTAIWCGPQVDNPCPVTISGTGTLTVNNVAAFSVNNNTGDPGTVTINTPIAGTGTIVKGGSGTLQLNATDTITGSGNGGVSLVIAGAGSCTFGANGAFGAGSVLWTVGGFIQPAVAGTAYNIPNNITHTNAVTETYAGNTGGVTFSGSQTLLSTGTTTLNNIASTITISGPISGAATLAVKVTGGTGWTFTGLNTYTGATTITSGTLTIGGSGDLGNSSGTGSYSKAIANTGAFVYNSSANQTLSGVISGTGTLTQSGSGTLTLSGANTYSGNTAINGGSISINGSTVTPFGNGAGTITLGGGNIIVTADRGTSANNITNPMSLTANSQFQSAGTTGTRNLVFGGPFTTTAGTLTIHETGTGAGPAVMNMRFTNTFTFSRPITFLVDTAGHSINLDIWNVSTLGDQTYSGVISGSGSIKRSVTTANTGGRVIFSAANTFSGGTSFNDGEIALGSDCAGTGDAPTSGPLGTGPITFGNDAGKLSASGAARNLFNHLLFSSSGKHLTLTGANNLTLSGNIDLGTQNVGFTNNNTGTSTFTGIVSNGSFTYQGPNTLTLSGTNTYTGTTTISNGTLALDVNGSISNSSSLILAAGATFDVSAISAYTLSSSTSLTAGGTTSPATINGGTTVDLGSQPITLKYDGSDPALTISQGTLSLNGNAFTVNGGALALGTYTLIQQASGNVTSSGIFTASGTAIGAGTAGYIQVTGGSVNLVVIPVPTFSNLTATPSITYGDTSVALDGTLSTTGSLYPTNGEIVSATINGHTVSGSVTDTVGDFSILFNDPSLTSDGAAAPLPITYSYAGGVTVGPATNNSTTSLTVSPASLSVTASAQTKTYGATAPATSSTAFSSIGLKNGEAIGSVSLAYSGSPSGGASNGLVSGSPYTITPSAATGGTFSAANYSIVYNPGSLTVNPATLTVSSIASRPFGATNQPFTATYTNFVNGETLGTSDVVGAPVSASVADTNSDVGNYDITNTIGTLASTNYNFSFVNGVLSVTNALSTNVVTADTNPALPSTTITFTSTVTTLAPSLAVPTNLVQFIIDGTNYGSPVSLTNGAAATTSSTLSHGLHSIVAVYTGDTNASGITNIVASTSAAYSQLINTPPTAGPASYGRPRDIGTHVNVSDLLTNTSDADGDTVSLVSVDSTSTNGAIISNSGGIISYTPPSTNGNVTDTFTYTVQDTFGALATNTVTISILPDNNGPSVNITGEVVLGDGTVKLDFAGIPNRNYLIQATTNISLPITWTTISTNTAGTNGLFEFIDLDATNFSTRYYRTAQP